MTSKIRTWITQNYPGNRFAEFLYFGFLQARACIFAGLFFALLYISNHIEIPGLARYDLLFIGALLIQALLIATKIETWDEVKVIFLFHLVGLVLEIFKTYPAIGSWSYPENGIFKIANVPLYSGFMYAAIGSYLSQAWRLESVRLEKYPAYIYSVTLCALIYLNFFTHHFIWDFRWLLGALVLILFFKTTVHFTIIREHKLPLPIVFLLVAFFIWIAENISTYLGAWKYPDQLDSWTIVSFSKITSWSLLIIISFIIVADLKQLKKSYKQNNLS